MPCRLALTVVHSGATAGADVLFWAASLFSCAKNSQQIPLRTVLNWGFRLFAVSVTIVPCKQWSQGLRNGNQWITNVLLLWWRSKGEITSSECSYRWTRMERSSDEHLSRNGSDWCWAFNILTWKLGGTASICITEVVEEALYFLPGNSTFRASVESAGTVVASSPSVVHI